jgi:hypothetical protein
MDYKEGSTVKVRLYSGQEVTAEITGIVSSFAGQKIRIIYEGKTALVSPTQVVAVSK